MCPVSRSNSDPISASTVAIENESTARKLLRLIEGLEESDDVQDVFANFDIPEQVLEVLERLPLFSSELLRNGDVEADGRRVEAARTRAEVDPGEDADGRAGDRHPSTEADDE